MSESEGDLVFDAYLFVLPHELDQFVECYIYVHSFCCRTLYKWSVYGSRELTALELAN